MNKCSAHELTIAGYLAKPPCDDTAAPKNALGETSEVKVNIDILAVQVKAV